MCEHKNVTVVTKYYPGTYYEPSETEVLHCVCDDCGEYLKGYPPEGANVTEVDHRDWY